jgi:hypothetical protein
MRKFRLKSKRKRDSSAAQAGSFAGAKEKKEAGLFRSCLRQAGPPEAGRRNDSWALLSAATYSAALPRRKAMRHPGVDVATGGEPFFRRDVFLTSRAGDRRRVGL